jgi:peptidylprolyl isomerase
VKDNIKATSPHPKARRGLRASLLSALVLLAAAALFAGCGSSGESSTITIGNENTSDQKLITAEDPQVPKTPTSGPLATKPAVEACKSNPTKLETKDIVTGTGKEAKNGSTVYVNYVGALCKNGQEFDSSWKRKEPFLFVIGTGEVISGWDKGVVGMKEGGRRLLTIPAELAYGKLGNEPKIPKNEPLVFVVDLLKVNSAGEG